MPSKAPPTSPSLARNSSTLDSSCLDGLGIGSLLGHAPSSFAGSAAIPTESSIAVLGTPVSQRDDRLMTATARTPDVNVVVVGAGIAGLYLVYRLTLAGHNAHIRGGRRTWRHVVLEPLSGRPGDIPSIDYMYSFDPRAGGVRVVSGPSSTPRSPRSCATAPRRRQVRPATPHAILDPESSRPHGGKRASLWQVRTDRGEESPVTVSS